MERRIFWLLYIFATINGALNLTCYCENTLRDVCINGTEMCPKSSDVCYVSISEYGVHEYDCWQLFELNDFVQECLRGPIVRDFISIQCCNNTDRCNEFLDPPLPLQLRTTTPITPTAEPRSGTALAESDNNGQIYIGLTIAIPTFSVILGIVIIIAAILYWFKKPLKYIWQGLVLKQSLVSCSRALFRILCCKKRARAEVLYDVPDYYAAPPLPPRKIPTIECDTKSYYDKMQDEVAPNGDVNNYTASGNPGTEVKFESRVPEIIQENISYLPSSRVSHLAANPAYGCNIAIAPEILTEENEAYNRTW